MSDCNPDCGFTSHRLAFRCVAAEAILLNHHKGSAIRGAIFGAVRHQFCVRKELESCHPCQLVATCPVSFLLATVDEAGRRGDDVPRPYTVQPPLGPATRYEAGEPFEFGVTLYARALSHLPYLIVAVHNLEQYGLGARVQGADGRWRRGTFRVERIVATDPLDGRTEIVMEAGSNLVHMPDFGVTHEAVLRRAEAMGQPDRLTIHFLTPTRIIDQGRLVQRPAFRPLVHRLVERISSLWEHYSDGSPPLDFPSLMAAAGEVRTVGDATRWVDLESYSSRRNARTPIGGFVGRATFQGPLAPLLPWLIWGEYTHVGKNAVKGDGWYRIGQDEPW